MISCWSKVEPLIDPIETNFTQAYSSLLLWQIKPCSDRRVYCGLWGLWSGNGQWNLDLKVPIQTEISFSFCAFNYMFELHCSE